MTLTPVGQRCMNKKEVFMLYQAMNLAGHDVKKASNSVMKAFPFGRKDDRYMTVFYNDVIDTLVIRQMIRDSRQLFKHLVFETYSLRLTINTNKQHEMEERSTASIAVDKASE